MNRFLVGFAVSWTLDKLAWKIALSDGDFGRTVLAKMVARLDHDKLLRLEDVVADEVVRRRTLVP